jgi:hypothetical protein
MVIVVTRSTPNNCLHGEVSSEELAVTELAPAFYGNKRFINMFIRA